MKNNSRTFLFLIVCLSVGGLISTDIFLPALGVMADFYHTSESGIQSSIAIFLLGLSVSQLIYGPLTDSLGRKTVLIVGLCIWLVSTVGILVSHTLHQLLVLRFLQGVGACSGITISRAIISDSFDYKAASHIYLTIFPFVGMSPAIGPLIGGILNNHLGWKSCFLFLLVFIVVTLILSVFQLKETLPKEKRHSLHPRIIMKNIHSTLLNKPFLFFSAVPCFAYAIYFAYLSESPFFFANLGLDKQHIGYTYFMLSLTYVIGNITAKRLCKKLGNPRAIKTGYLIFFIGGLSFSIQLLISPYPIITSIIAISILTFGNGFLLPLGTAAAIASKPDMSGTASGVMGSLQLASAALASFLVGYLSHHKPEITALIISILSIVGFTLYQIGYKKYASPVHGAHA